MVYCECGYKYETDPVAIRQAIAEQRVNARMMLIGAIVLGVGALGFPVLAIAMQWMSPRAVVAASLSALPVAVALGRKASRILDATRANLDALPAAHATDQKTATPSP
jgi:hypothetical protein